MKIFSFFFLLSKLLDASGFPSPPLANKAALIVKDGDELFEKSFFLLSHPEKREELGKNALAFLEQSKGAAKKTIDLIEVLYKQKQDINRNLGD